MRTMDFGLFTTLVSKSVIKEELAKAQETIVERLFEYTQVMRSGKMMFVSGEQWHNFIDPGTNSSHAILRNGTVYLCESSKEAKELRDAFAANGLHDAE